MNADFRAVMIWQVERIENSIPERKDKSKVLPILTVKFL
jgi:hypothetical protein